MANKIVQLENEDGDNLYPLAGGALTGSISKTMLEEGVFEGPELSEPNTVAYVAEGNIQDDAVTTTKIADGVVTSDKLAWDIQKIELSPYIAVSGASSVGYIYKLGKLCILNVSLYNATLSGVSVTIYSNLPLELKPIDGLDQWIDVSGSAVTSGTVGSLDYNSGNNMLRIGLSSSSLTATQYNLFGVWFTA